MLQDTMSANSADYNGEGFTFTETTVEYGYLTTLPDGTVLSRGGWSKDRAYMKDQVKDRNLHPFGDESYHLISRVTTETVTIKAED